MSSVALGSSVSETISYRDIIINSRTLNYLENLFSLVKFNLPLCVQNRSLEIEKLLVEVKTVQNGWLETMSYGFGVLLEVFSLKK